MDTEKHCTPVGTLVWPHLNTPRQYQGQGDFAYDTCIDFEGKPGEEVAAWLKKYALDLGKRKGAKVSLSSVLVDAMAKDDDGNTIELPGVTRVKFKVPNKMTSTGLWERKPAFVDPAGNPIRPEPMVGGGTKAKIYFEVYEWKHKAGMTLQPVAIMIHNLCEYREKSESSFLDEALSISSDNGHSANHPADF